MDGRQHQGPRPRETGRLHRDFNGVAEKLDGQGNYTLGLKEQIIFPEIDIDKNPRIHGLEITFVTTAKTDEEAYALLKEFGIPFKKHNK